MRSQPLLIEGLKGLLALSIRIANEMVRKLTAWSKRGTLVLGSSFWSFSSKVLSGTPKSLFSTTETTFSICTTINNSVTDTASTAD